MKKLLFPAAALAIVLSASALAAPGDSDNSNNRQHERANRDSSAPNRSNGGGNAMTNRGGGDSDKMRAANRPTRDASDDAGDNDRVRKNRTVNDSDRTRNNTTVIGNDRVRNKTTINGNDRVRNKTIVNDNDRIRNNTTVNRTVNKKVVRKTVDRSTVIKFRANIRAPHRYHFNRTYVRPAGFYVHRWTYGERLPRAFFAPDYFILDFATFGLMTPWSGYEWVRYGNDALLIDVETGEVIRVEYDLFY